MKTLGYTRAFVDRAASTDKTIRFVGATEGEKPDGINLKMSGARLDRYRANPIFGWGHSYYGRTNLPIGKSEKTEVDEQSRLMFDIAFDRKDAFGAETERKYREGFLNAVSIGFSVIEWADPKTQDYYRGGDAVDWELYELSGVPLPMDANAVVDSGRNGGLVVEQELLDAVRGLLNRLDANSIAALRALLDASARVPGEEVRGYEHRTADEHDCLLAMCPGYYQDIKSGRSPLPKPREDEEPAAGTRRATTMDDRRRRLRLAGITS